jgi:hypothetical protein
VVHPAIRSGSDAVNGLVQEMNRDRVKRLEWIGFPSAEAEELSSLHTRNFM